MLSDLRKTAAKKNQQARKGNVADGGKLKRKARKK